MTQSPTLTFSESPKFKKGSLCLYNQRGYFGKYYIDVPVIILRMNKNYKTWLCLFPDGITGFYNIQFKRLLGGSYQHVEDNTPMWRIIEVVIAAQEPLHVETLEYLVIYKVSFQNTERLPSHPSSARRQV